jgi:protein PsiE
MSQQNESIIPHFQIPLILQGALNSALVLLAVSLSVLLGKEIFYFIQLSVFNQGIDDHYLLLERILIFFLYFEFIAMIVKYFQENYHFPLRYFLYIGITAMIRVIIVNHDNPADTLLCACTILVLIISYSIMSFTSARRHKI